MQQRDGLYKSNKYITGYSIQITALGVCDHYQQL